MEFELILDGAATLEEMYQLSELGYTFVIANGKVEEICKEK